MVTRHIIDLIVSDDTIRNGQPCVAGTGVRVLDIALAKIAHAQDAEGIAEWYDLSLPQVYAGLAYYYDNQAEIDSEIRRQMQLAREMKEQGIGKRHSLLS
ncbi:MAG: DUF433 domain-containing protein [Phototrophicaceae bacterium]